MNNIHTAKADGGGTSRRAFIQRAGLGLVGVASLPALLAAPAGVVAAGRRSVRRVRCDGVPRRRSRPAARSSAR